ILAWDRSGKHPKMETRDGFEIRRCQVRCSFGGGIRQFGKFVLFYLWAFIYLMTHRCDAVHCHDLDTLPVGFLAGILKFKEVVYDSHEPYYAASGQPSSGRISAL